MLYVKAGLTVILKAGMAKQFINYKMVRYGNNLSIFIIIIIAIVPKLPFFKDPAVMKCMSLETAILQG